MRELHAKDFDPVCSEPFGVALRRPLARVVGVVGQFHPPHVAQRFPQFVAEAFGAEQTRHVAEAVRAKRQRIEHRFAQDDFLGVANACAVQQAAMRPRTVEVLEFAPCRRRARDAPPVKAHRLSRCVEQGHDDAAVEVFVPALAPQAKLLQPPPQLLAFRAVGERQAQAQRPIGDPDLKAGDEFLVEQSARFEVSPRRMVAVRKHLEPFVIITHHLAEQRGVVRLRIERTRQARDGRTLQRPWLRRTARAERHGAALVQHLEGMTERDPIMPRDELNGVARRATRHAMKESLLRRDDEVRRFLVRVEGAAPDPVLRTMLPEFDASALDQRPQIRRALDPLDVRFRNAVAHSVS